MYTSLFVSYLSFTVLLLFSQSHLIMKQVFHNSIAFGYSLRRVTERFNLERLVPVEEGDIRSLLQTEQFSTYVPSKLSNKQQTKTSQICENSVAEKTNLPGIQKQFLTSNTGITPKKKRRENTLRHTTSPVSSSSSASKGSNWKKNLQRYASHFLESRDASLGEESGERKFRSREAGAVAERQTQALFGDVDVLSQQLQRISKQANNQEDLQRCMERAMRNGEIDAIELPVVGIQCLVLQAIAIGSYLWDVERKVDLLCPLTTHD
mmetsp:Transcript_28995/g.40037  ORF Transcript_28995/g.40037 Transcript_28995/m.40037 type:complete len:265 (-) Transcript_28995:197-991(-)